MSIVTPETVERYSFFTQGQDQEEGRDSVTELKALASICNFGNITDSRIADRITCGTSDLKLRERLLREVDLTLEKWVQVPKVSELSKKRIKTITGAEQAHKVNREEPRRQNQVSPTENAISGIHFLYYGKQHEKQQDKCPAYGQRCLGPGKQNHFVDSRRNKAALYVGGEKAAICNKSNEV